MYLLIVFLPLLGSSVAGFFGRFLGSEGTAIMTTTCVSFSSILSLIAFYEVAPGASACYLRIAPWISSEMFDASWGFFGDREVWERSWSGKAKTAPRIWVARGRLCPDGGAFRGRAQPNRDITPPTSSAPLYRLNHSKGLVGGTGEPRELADKAAIKAMLVNRVGDFGLAPGISGRFTLFQTVDFSTIFACASAPRNSWISCNMRLNAITLICILLLIGAVGKSAQIGSHTWSPDAMEGPTPVSASIHAATMVTAGVFMIARCSPLFEYSPTALIVITFAGAMTSFLAATTGILQNDLKRVIAYSTCSQLGYMIFACGISNYSVSVFHLMNHAFFKALLFLSAGSVIHAMSDEQDMRKMGGLASSFPFTYAMMLMGSLSLIGFPFLTGFYSKDVILELAYTKYTISGNFAFWLGSVSVLFTSYYSFRSLFLTFLVPTNSFGRDIVRCHDAPIPMAIPLILLALGSLFVGYLAKGILQPWEPGLRHPSFAVDVSAKFVCRQLNVSISIHGRICKRFPVARRHPSPGIDLYHFRRNDIKVITFSLVSRSGVPSSLALRPRYSVSGSQARGRLFSLGSWVWYAIAATSSDSPTAGELKHFLV
ncbi:hypothetical protein DKX38_030069 (mitochondrion) [Salix brachista]|uniref:NADH:quinone oxidoreductase/Mrp antiporter transmembrane domain-containing protein n=1 Tax=Salix brachista TaxID=2182728 RepID=A0A5N5J001_9ROSI|nr:hypothetical protein DKX38_030069 [Salix brachista]